VRQWRLGLVLLGCFCVYAEARIERGQFRPTSRLLFGSIEGLSRDLTSLWTELPLDAFTDEVRKELREKFVSASTHLKLALDAAPGSEARFKAMTKGTAELRELGLWLPFVALAADSRNRTARRFLDVEDQALALTASLSTLVLKSQPDHPFELGLEHWRLLPGAVTLREAELRCSSLGFEGTKRWRLPSIEELWRTQAVLKNPRTNLAFGKDAEKLGKVWTGTKAPGDRQFYYVNFATDKIELSSESSRLETVCVGEVEDGS
jgi:hypothetical protein